jgi:hypothetical protein
MCCQGFKTPASCVAGLKVPLQKVIVRLFQRGFGVITEGLNLMRMRHVLPAMAFSCMGDPEVAPTLS